MDGELIGDRDVTVSLKRINGLVSEAMKGQVSRGILVRLRENFEMLRHYLSKEKRESFGLKAIDEKLSVLESRNDIDELDVLVFIQERVEKILSEIGVEY